MTRRSLVLRYTAIAVSASVLNLLLQAIIVRIYTGPIAVELAMVAATGIVLPIKYSVEKHLIFGFQPNSLIHDAKLFSLYTFVSVFTVLIFWCTEYAFQLLFQSEPMRYVGATIGLAISFYMKYALDRHFVFIGATRGTK